jgi:hypothetical protein
VQQSSAAGSRLKDTAAGDPFDLDRFDLPAADAMVYLAAHVGEGFYLLHAIDASVTDERDPVSCDPALDLYDPANRFVEPPGESRYEPEFVKRYRDGQRARVERIDAVARERVARRREARARWDQSGSVGDRRRSIATDFLTVYRTDADPRFVDLSLDGSRRPDRYLDRRSSRRSRRHRRRPLRLPGTVASSGSCGVGRQSRRRRGPTNGARRGCARDRRLDRRDRLTI